MPVVRLRQLSPEAREPRYETAGAAGMDLAAGISAPLTIPPNGGRALVSTGWAIAIPEGYEGQVRPRSGLAARHGVTVLNSPGTIDTDFRGEVRVLLINHGPKPFEIRSGDRIAQLVISPIVRVTIEVGDAPLDETGRGEGGFGSTGVRG